MIVDRALALAREGFKVFPVAPRAKGPPLVKDWPHRATTDPETIRQFWLATPEANIGVHCEGLLVLDVDPGKGGEGSYLGLDLLYGPTPATLSVITPSGGRHLYFRLPAGHPGVPNSVSTLGAGLDIRSTGGYVLAPGSTTGAGEYRWGPCLPGRAIIPAPDWLLAKIGTATPKAPAASVPDAPQELVDGARTWLLAQPPAVEGQGGDACTYEAACGLRDRGVSQRQAVELLAEWNETCQPPWDLETLAAKAANAYRYAENPPGARVALPEDFPEVKPAPAAPKPRSVIKWLRDTPTGKLLNPDYAIKGLLPRNSYATAYGAPGEGKTFVALDWSYHVAAGLPWMGHRVRPGVVLYLAYEGGGGLDKRKAALIQKYGNADAPLATVDAAFNLRELAGRQALGRIIADLPAKPSLIVIDTFAHALMGDENSAEDVGAFYKGIDALIESTHACVLLLHHSGKDKTKGLRGSSALLGALDTVIEIDSGYVTVTKQREGETGESIAFKLVPVMVGIDDDGDDITTCVVEASTGLPKGLPRLKGYAKQVFDTLCELRPTNTPIAVSELKAACLPFIRDGKNKTGRFNEALAALVKAGYVKVDPQDETITRSMT